MNRKLYGACAALFVAFLLAASPAWAVRGHVFAKAFGTAGSGPGQLDEPSAVAVQQVDEATSGDVYVADQGNDRVEVFSPAGAFLFEFNGSGASLNEKSPAGSGGFAGEEETGRFEAPDGIAIDNSCALGKTPAEKTACLAADPSAGDVYVVDSGNNVIDKFSPSGEYVAQLAGFEEEGFRVPLFSVAVDNAGELWAAYGGPIGTVKNFTNAIHNEPLEGRSPQYQNKNGFLEPGIAVGSSDDFYLVNRADRLRVSEFTGTGAPLSEELDGERTTAVAVEEPGDDAYVDNVSSIARFDAQGNLLERFGEGHLGSGAGIAVAAEPAAASTVYATDRERDEVVAFGAEPSGPPTVEDASVSDVASDSAKLQAEVNPRGLATTAHFEYGPCTSSTTCATSPYGEETAAVDAGSEFSLASIGPIAIAGLTPGTAYHYRAVVENEAGRRDGAELIFTTQARGTSALIDGRQWEMVSPGEKQGALILPLDSHNQPSDGIEAAARAPEIAYLTNAPTGSSPAGNTNEQQVLSTRGEHEWSSRDLSLPHEAVTGLSVSAGQEYRYFAPDLSRAVVQPFGSVPPLSVEASEATAYLEALPCATSDPQAPFEAGSCFQPLVTGKDGYANVLPGAVFGIAEEEQSNECPPSLICGPQYVGSSLDARHVVVASGVRLTTTAPARVEGGEGGIYERGGGRLTFISVLPRDEGSEPIAGIVGSTAAPETGGAGTEARNAVSSDGSRVFWSSHRSEEVHLYLRDLAREETLRLDVPESGVPESGAAEFQGASPDGTRAWFEDIQPLTANASAGRNLYECEIKSEPGGPLSCELRDLTPANPATGGGLQGAEGGVLGSLPGTSQAGCDVGANDECNIYFVSNGAYGPKISPGDCTNSAHGQGQRCNLYVIHDGEPPKLIAVLSGADGVDWALGEGSLEFMLASVSPSGRWLDFTSLLSLTGYDNRDASSGKPVQEAYLYDAQSGKLDCVSCDPTGARPSSLETGPNDGNAPLVDAGRAWSHAQLAATLPAWETYSLKAGRYQPRSVDDEGRVFFDAYDGLVSHDVNRQWDVYEYEPSGVGNCAPGLAGGTSNYRPAKSFDVDGRAGEEASGCVGLMSSGAAGQETALLDASETGGDVYFMTASPLSSQDKDGAYDVYDAHECSSEFPCLAPTSEPVTCTTADACRAAPSPQPGIFGAPSSATFSGPRNSPPPVAKPAAGPSCSSSAGSPSPKCTRAQNLRKALASCKRTSPHAKKKRASCEARARKRYASHKTKTKPAKAKKRKKK